MLSRREVTGILLLVAPFGEKANAQDSTEFMVRIRADERALDAAVPAIEQKALDISPDKSPEAEEFRSRSPKERAAPILLIIVGSIAAVNLAKMVLELLRAYYYGGVVIDARVKPPLISNDIKIPVGTVVVIAEDGSKATFKESDVSAEFVNAVLKRVK